jgi:hypothetical protein
MNQVRIVRGEYHYKPVAGVYTLVKPYQSGKRGGFVTVLNDGTLGNNPVAGKPARINVNTSGDFEYLSGAAVQVPAGISAFTMEAQPVVEESDAEAMDRIATRFAILDEMSKACISSDIRAMIVSGPPGVGKSFGVQAQLEKYSLFDQLGDSKIRYEIVKGAMTPLGLYAQLYKFSDKNNVLVFDDCDSVFADDLSLNILKAALDSGKRRKIFWNSDSAMLRREGIPDQFDFNGSVIFITNVNFETVRSQKLKDHLEALQSRCHYLDLTIDTVRDKMLRIRQVHRDASKDMIGGLFAEYDFENGMDEQILDFMWDNKDKLREISLRMSLKIADLVKISPNNWKMLTKNTCMRG